MSDCPTCHQPFHNPEGEAPQSNHVTVTIYEGMDRKAFVIFRVGDTEMHLEPNEARQLAVLLNDAAKLCRDPRRAQEGG